MRVTSRAIYRVVVKNYDSKEIASVFFESLPSWEAVIDAFRQELDNAEHPNVIRALAGVIEFVKRQKASFFTDPWKSGNALGHNLYINDLHVGYTGFEKITLYTEESA